MDRPSWRAVALVALAGVVLRLAISFLGSNFDLESWRIIAGIMDHGGNVYAETYRHPYGPPWFLVLHLLDRLPDLGFSPESAFAFKVTAFLTLIDLAIYAVVMRRFGLLAACLFLLNPISVFITGYHRQIDNIAILIALLAICRLERGKGVMNSLPSLILLGISLSVKHVFLFLPIWLAMKETGLLRKVLFVTVPIAVFALTFVPYWAEGSKGIVENVIHYRSFDNAPFWRLFGPELLNAAIPAVALFGGAMLIAGLALAKSDVMDIFLIYLVCLVVFSSALANQYLVIPAIAIAVNRNPVYAIYVAWSVFYLAIDRDGLMINFFGSHWMRATAITRYICVGLLALGLVLQLWPGQFRQGMAMVATALNWLKCRVREQVLSLGL